MLKKQIAPDSFLFADKIKGFMKAFLNHSALCWPKTAEQTVRLLRLVLLSSSSNSSCYVNCTDKLSVNYQP